MKRGDEALEIAKKNVRDEYAIVGIMEDFKEWKKNVRPITWNKFIRPFVDVCIFMYIISKIGAPQEKSF